MNPQTPSAVVIVSAIVLLLNTFAKTNIAGDQVESVVNAVTVLVLAGASAWAWIKTRTLVKQNKELTASLSAARFAAKAKK